MPPSLEYDSQGDVLFSHLGVVLDRPTRSRITTPALK